MDWTVTVCAVVCAVNGLEQDKKTVADQRLLYVSQ